MKVAITYHEDFGKNGFSVLKERIRPSFETLMKSGLVDGIDVQVFKARPAPLELVEQGSHPSSYGQYEELIPTERWLCSPPAAS